jgi:UDP-GlcNAc:undecaprenyl-phosphate/decaprenyl-phosphate GlcNAc-1-phosphate transferase
MTGHTSRAGQARRSRAGQAGRGLGGHGQDGRGPFWSAAAALTSAARAAGIARAAYTALSRRPPGGASFWTRTNHRGEPVTLAEGPALAFAAVITSALDGGLSPRLRAALAVAGTGAAGFGGYDDLAGDGDRRGFRGHLGALAQGEVTTGAVKLGGIGATGLAAAAVLGGSPADVTINAGLIAGSANLVNLFDLRPGRALKVALAGGALLAAGTPAGRGAVPGQESARAVAAPLGAALAMLGEDLGERAMLGDAGANGLGALLGVAAAASLPRPARAALLAGITGLTAASEKVSFTAVIERTPALRWFDMLGRRRPAPAAPARERPAGPLPAGARDAGARPAGARDAGHTAAATAPASTPPPHPSP